MLVALAVVASFAAADAGPPVADDAHRAATSRDDARDPASAAVVDAGPSAAPAPTTAELLACPKGSKCVDDAVLLAAVLRLEDALANAAGDGGAAARAAVEALAATGDPRAVPILLRGSRAKDRALRLTSLGALVRFAPTVQDAETRLREALAPDAPPEDAAVALPGLLAATAGRPGPSAVPCPAGATCVDDAVLLAALLAFDRAAAGRSGDERRADGVDAARAERDEAALVVAARARRIAEVAALADPRALPFLWRWSYAPDEPLRVAAVAGLAPFAGKPAVRKRLLDALTTGKPAEKLAALGAVSALVDDALVDELFAARAAEGDANVKAAVEATLRARAPARLDEVLEEERRLAELKALEPDAFDTANRAVVTGAAAVLGAAAGGASTAVIANLAQPGLGGCFGLWGGCAGAASAGAITWFALGDRQLDYEDVGLALSGALWGGAAGLFVPRAIADPTTYVAAEHFVYASGGGALVGLGAAAFAATALDLDASDLVEMHLGVVALDAAALGLLFAEPFVADARLGYASLVAATAIGVAAGAGNALLLDMTTEDMVHSAVLLGIGAVAGLSTGIAIVAPAGEDPPLRAVGVGLLGGAAGLGVSVATSALKITPSWGGLVYESWAGVDGWLLGLGGGLLIEELAGGAGFDPFVLPFAGAATGMVLGATTTALFPDGIEQDVGDLLLQPLLGGFALYHAAALTAAGSAPPRYVGAAAALAPAAVSAALVYSAPFVDATAGDVLMVASTMAWGAYGSSMVLGSLALRGSPASTPLSWVLGTSLAMDAGLLVGVGLNYLPIDDLGWRVTYVSAVTAASTLVLGVPGSLVALYTGGALTIPDMMLVSSLIGLVAGVATAPFIDFRVAPDLGLGRRQEATAARLDVVPTVVALAPSPTTTSTEPVMVPGVVGRF